MLGEPAKIAPPAEVEMHRTDGSRLSTNEGRRRLAMKFIVPLAIGMAWTAHAQGKVRTETVDYSHGDVQLQGFLAYDDERPGPRPGVLLVHDWTGVGPYAKGRAEMLAAQGYVAFALDMYGKDIRPTTQEECAKQAGIYRADRGLMRARAAAGLEQLKKLEIVDPKRIAVIGYCFGGGVALELARAGADLEGVVVFHGNLDTPNPDDAKKIKAKVLVCHGADDPYVPPAQVAAFEDEMRKAGVDWTLISYGGAVHSFTRPDAGNDNSKGAAYNESADKRSWGAMTLFFNEIFR
jgi:dienelactone hydrolase